MRESLVKKAFEFMRAPVAALALSGGVQPMISFPPASAQEVAHKTAAEKLADELRGKSFQEGSRHIITWARTKPYEVSTVFVESNNNNGAWIDLRAGGYVSVLIPTFGAENRIGQRLQKYIVDNATNSLDLCISHTHTRNYLDRLKKGNIDRNEKRQLERLNLSSSVSKEIDPRGFSDVFDIGGPFATPPSARDIAGSTETSLRISALAKKLNVKINVAESVTNSLGIWYWRPCATGECFDEQALNAPDTSEIISVEQLQANWAVFVNRTKNQDGTFLSGAQILASKEHHNIVRGYARHGVKTWFVPQDSIASLKGCRGE